MAFFRENVFLLAIVGVTVVVGGFFLLMHFNADGEVNERIASRIKLFSTLSSLGRGKNANDAAVKAQKERVLEIQAAAEQILQESISWNKQTYPVMQLRYIDRNNSAQIIPAFPIATEEFQRRGLTFVFIQEYRLQLQKMLETLDPTRAPTGDEIRREQEQLGRKLELLRSAEERKHEAAVGLSEPGRDRGARSTSIKDVSEEAREKGLQSIWVKKARGGEIYATLDSLDVFFSQKDISATNAEIWQAQVNLWVTGDILEVIRQTNMQAIQNIDQSHRNVLTSAVKRLASIDVRDYYTGGAVDGRSGSRDRGVPVLDVDRLPPEMRSEPFGRRQTRQAEPGEIASTLTGHVCCQLYDVVHYDFTVVMPMRYLSLLEENLLRRSNHTILSVEIDSVRASGASDYTSMGGGGRSSGDQFYYYGAEPVVQVKINGELLLLTSWHRGTWDAQNRRWSTALPPLMPLDVLQAISAASPGAMRSEDNQRLSPEETGRSGRGSRK